MTQKYPWKRFWKPLKANFDLSDAGFLTDPESLWGQIANKQLAPFRAIAEKPCLALLGKAGIGKSKAMAAEKSEIDNEINAAGGETLWLDLRSFSSEDRLFNALFKSETFRKWMTGEFLLHLFLDSLDECLLRIDTAASLLIDELKNHPLSRLKLRIACRTSRWPQILQSNLPELWGGAEFAAYELTPLRRGDVRLAAAIEGIPEPDKFVEDLITRDLVPLAITPVTLKLLLSIFRKEGSFPADQGELYARGCRLLCDTGEDRAGTRSAGALTSGQRFVIASRIAAATVFGKRYAIWNGPGHEDVPDEDIAIHDLCHGYEVTDGRELAVTYAATLEVLDTGLFESRGANNRIGWAHQSYADFLAAYYCQFRKAPVEQILRVLVHPSDPSGKLVPQLHESAAWLAGMRPDIFEHISREEPELLLSAAVGNLSVAQRASLVSALLRQCENGRMLNLRWGMYDLYRKLSHPNLAQQLRRHLAEPTASDITRQVSIEIAHATELNEVQQELVDIALDVNANLETRSMAAAAVADVGDVDARKKLHSLAFGEAGPDPQDELKGYGLASLWPSAISLSEILPLLTPPKNTSFSGGYATFLRYRMVDHIPLDQLAAALQWVAGLTNIDGTGSLQDLVGRMFERAWEHLDQPAVASAFATSMLARLRVHDQPFATLERAEFQGKVNRDDHRRRLVLGAMLPMMHEDEWRLIAHLSMGLIDRKDFNWLLQQRASNEAIQMSVVEAQIISAFLDPSDRAQMDAVWAAVQNDPDLNRECEGAFLILLNSTAAKMNREHYEDLERAKLEQTSAKSFDPMKRILLDIEKFEAGELDYWNQLTWDLTLQPGTKRNKPTYQPDVTVTPGWQAANPETRNRIAAAAKRYLEMADPLSSHDAKNAGFKALALLTSSGNASPLPLVWKKWLRSMLEDFSDNADEVRLRRKLVANAYRDEPDTLIDHILLSADRQAKSLPYLFATNFLDDCWDERLRSVLLSKAREPDITPDTLAILLAQLLRHNAPGARELAESMVVVPPPQDEQHRAKMKSVMQVLITRTKDAGWAVVWPVLHDHPDFGLSVLINASYSDPAGELLGSKLSVQQLAEFYVWLVARYPYAQPSTVTGTYAGRGPTAAFQRDITLTQLVNRGTFEACAALQWVLQRLPQLDWLPFHIEAAERIARSATWPGVEPVALIQILSDPKLRIVRTGNELLTVVVESLDRLQHDLHAEFAQIKFLWLPTDNDKGLYKPRFETDLADYVAAYLDKELRERGIIVAAEVTIRRGHGQQGEITDIHIDAVVPAYKGTTTITATIEVKGSWHRELSTAMETQLRNRYLRGTRCRHGLYLVGWFNCQNWDPGDYRKADAPKWTLEEAKQRFSAQALALSDAETTLAAFVLDTRLE